MTETTTVTAAAMRIVRLLVGNPPATVADLIAAMGVTRTAVTEQLNELVAAGFVERTTERLPGRGRPRHLYATTTAALLLLFASNQRLVVPAIWQAVAEEGGPELLSKVVGRVTRSMAQRYCERVTAATPEDRLRQVNDLLLEEGHLVEVFEDAEGRVTLRKRSCPFISMFESTRTVCGVDRDLISTLIGAPVEKTMCRHDGSPCCAFAIASNGR